MSNLPVLVALSLVPCRARLQLVSRLQERHPQWTAGEAGGLPPLDRLIDSVAPEAGNAPDLTRRLERRAREALARADAAEVRPLVCGSASYPALLAAIPDPPLVLWARGRVGPAPAVAVVGARAATPGALEMARWLARDLAAAGVVVVSGLARGVDAAAHRGAVDAGSSVAVLGCGVDVIYPPEHRELASRLLVSGALVSELPPGMPPLAHHFPLRNRIISGLSLGVVVVEASERSGSLITARCALDQGRDVLAVPGPVLSGRNRGAHALLRDGARLVESAGDVLDEIGIRLSAAQDGPAEVLDDEPLLRCLPLGDPVDLDAIAALTGLGTDRVLSALTGLELRGVVTRTAGGRFVRAIRKW